MGLVCINYCTWRYFSSMLKCIQYLLLTICWCLHVTLDKLFYQLVWYSNFLKENLGPSKVIFFSPFSAYFLISVVLWDKLMFDSFRMDLAICSPYEHVGYIRSKWKRILWFSTIRSLRKLGGLVGNSPAHQFCTITDFCLNSFRLFSWHDCIY